MEAFTIKKVSRLPPRSRNQRVGFSTADLDFDNFGASHGFVGILYSDRFPFLYSDHLEGRQTVESHLVHIGTNSYRRTRNDVINFHLSAFFCGFYFRGSRSVRENRENLHPAKISRYTVFAVTKFSSTEERGRAFGVAESVMSAV